MPIQTTLLRKAWLDSDPWVHKIVRLCQLETIRLHCKSVSNPDLPSHNHRQLYCLAKITEVWKEFKHRNWLKKMRRSLKDTEDGQPKICAYTNTQPIEMHGLIGHDHSPLAVSMIDHDW